MALFLKTADMPEISFNTENAKVQALSWHSHHADKESYDQPPILRYQDV